MSEHHVVISADTHCGADLWDYKEYLPSKYHEDFDVWAKAIKEGERRTAEAFKDAERSPLNVGVDGDSACVCAGCAALQRLCNTMTP